MKTAESEDADLQPTRDTSYRIKQWINATQHVASCESHLRSAQTDVLNVTNELGRFLSPPDAKIGEVFNIWYSDGLLAIKKIDSNGNGTFDVSWRKRPRKI